MNERFLLSGIGGLAVLAISACGSANAGTAALTGRSADGEWRMSMIYS